MINWRNIRAQIFYAGYLKIFASHGTTKERGREARQRLIKTQNRWRLNVDLAALRDLVRAPLSRAEVLEKYHPLVGGAAL